MAAALEVLNTVKQENFLTTVEENGELLLKELRQLQAEFSIIRDVRGVGLILGIELKEEKALSFWPDRFLRDDDSNFVLDVFRSIVKSGRHVTFMAHFNHVAELKTRRVQEAISKIRATGAEIRTQSPLLRHINDTANDWMQMWEEQIRQGCIPYYMFIARDTGAQHYFAVELNKALDIFNDAIRQTAGLCRTVRGPVMSAKNGKVEILNYDLSTQIYTLRYIQHRNPGLAFNTFVAKPKVDKPIWIDDLCCVNPADFIYF